MTNQERIDEAISENRGWFIVLGFIFVLAGGAALAFPFFSSIAVDVIVGASMFVAGLAMLIQAFWSGSWSQLLFQIIVGAIYALTGAVLLAHPVQGAVALTLVAGFAFIVEGIVRCGFAIQIQPKRGWGWMLLGSLVSIVVGFALVLQLPMTGLFALGILAGINLIVTGWTLIMLAAAASDAEEPIPAGSHAAN